VLLLLLRRRREVELPLHFRRCERGGAKLSSLVCGLGQGG
jgi:hypothetical protein